jgi:hypothetical protein
VPAVHSSHPTLTVDGLLTEQVYLAAELDFRDRISHRGLNPAARGWVVGIVPHEIGTTLYKGWISAKSDWYDREQGRMLENPLSLVLFKQVAPFFRKRLHRPMWAYDLRSGQARSYRDIGYSDGVVEWVRQGGLLRQQGVAYVGLASPIQPQRRGGIAMRRHPYPSTRGGVDDPA